MPTVPQALAKHRLQHPPAAPTPATAARLTALRTSAAATLPESLQGPEHEPLFFPHALDLDDLDQSTEGIAEMESRLRFGQLRSSLDKLRLHLHIKQRMLVFKAQNIRHQASVTRALGLLDSNEGKLIGFAEKYRAAHAAYKELVGDGPWQAEWRELRREDIRLLRDSKEPTEDEVGTEGHREVSWIWQTGDKQQGTIPGIANGTSNLDNL